MPWLQEGHFPAVRCMKVAFLQPSAGRRRCRPLAGGRLVAEGVFGVRGAFVDRAAHLLPEAVEAHGAAEHEPRHRQHHRGGPQPRRGVEQARPVVPEQDQRRHPARRADRVRRDVAAVVHPRRAGDHRGERADPGDPPRDDDRPEAPALEEGRRPGQVRPVEHPAFLAGEHAGAGVAADEVAHLVPGHRDGRGDAAEHPGPRLVPVLGQQHPRGDQQRVAGQEQPDDERALEEDEHEHDDPDRDRPGLTEERQRQGRHRATAHSCEGSDVRDAGPRSAAQAGPVGRARPRRARSTSMIIGSTESSTIAMSISSMLALTTANWPSQNPSRVTPAAQATPPMRE